MKMNIATIPGDGIGPDIVREGCRVLEAVGKKFGHEFVFTETLSAAWATPKAKSTCQILQSQQQVR